MASPLSAASFRDARVVGGASPNGDTSTPSSPRAKILIADDDPTVRAVIRRLLTTKLDADVRETADGLGVLEVLREGSIDLLILDIGMGLLNGAETLCAVRRNDLFKDLPVVVISGTADETHVKWFQSQGVQGFFAKPISPVVLHERLLPLLTALLPARPTPPPQTTEPVTPKISLRASTRVFIVGEDEEQADVVKSLLGAVCHVVRYPSATLALRDVVDRPPDLVFLASVDPIVPPALFARATRRESKHPPRLILCSSSAAPDETDVHELFDVVLPRRATEEDLLEALRSQLTDRSISLIVLHTVAADTLRHSLASVVRQAVGEPASASRGVPRWDGTERHGAEASIVTPKDGSKWNLMFMMTHSAAIAHASGLMHGNTDVVSHDAAIDCVKALAGHLAAELCSSWADYDIDAQVGSLVTRSVRWWEDSSSGSNERPLIALWAARKGSVMADVAVTIASLD